ncbi:hypothetical protein [Pseudolysobacter antarcticus]|uniref:hypothetical protein n=1 Tax=Pseudolysobacter antarcticus TaxID=2511995 RepID=UPI0013EDEB07|nr:hypothetical protein [Pseudolysobacter antarcticus]
MNVEFCPRETLEVGPNSMNVRIAPGGSSAPVVVDNRITVVRRKSVFRVCAFDQSYTAQQARMWHDKASLQ